MSGSKLKSVGWIAGGLLLLALVLFVVYLVRLAGGASIDSEETKETTDQSNLASIISPTNTEAKTAPPSNEPNLDSVSSSTNAVGKSESEEVSEEVKEKKRGEPSDRILVRQPDELYDIDNKFHRPFIMDGYIHKYEKEVGLLHDFPKGITSKIDSYLGPVATFKVMLEEDNYDSFGRLHNKPRKVTLFWEKVRFQKNWELVCHMRKEHSHTWESPTGIKSTGKDVSGWTTKQVAKPFHLKYGVTRCGYGYYESPISFKFVHSIPLSQLHHERSVNISQTSSLQVILKMSALRSNHTYNLIRASTDKKDDIPFKDRFAQVKVDSSGELYYIDESISQDSEISLQDDIWYAIEDPDVEGVFEIIGRAWTSA
eukprot:748651_1